MKFDFEQLTDDGGGALIVTAENTAEVAEVAKHFRIFDKDDPAQLMKLAEAMQAGVLIHRSHSEKRPWFEVESALEFEFTQPYLDRLAKVTGFTDYPPDMDLTEHHPRRLCHTHITDKVWLEGGHICYRSFVQSEDWNGMAAADRSFNTAEDYTQEDFGERPFEQEYIPVKGGGLMKRNPNYLKRHRAKPACKAEWFYRVLFNWYMANKATDKQREVYNASQELHKGSRWRDADCDFELRSYQIYYLDPQGTCNYDGKGTMVSSISQADFAKL